MQPRFPNEQLEHHPMRPTRLFLDAEFANFESPGSSRAKLLSLALVDEQGLMFYAETDSWETSDLSDFVVESVLPLLTNSKEKIVEIANRLHAFLDSYEYAVIHCDYRGDWDWLVWVLSHSTISKSTWPSCLHHEPYCIDVSKWGEKAKGAMKNATSEWFSHCAKHHAANDANSLRYGWLKAREALNWVDDPGSIE